MKLKFDRFFTLIAVYISIHALLVSVSVLIASNFLHDYITLGTHENEFLFWHSIAGFLLQNILWIISIAIIIISILSIEIKNPTLIK